MGGKPLATPPLTWVELRGIEPLTYSMRTSRATNCATAPMSPSGTDETLAVAYWPTARR
jgi:hypothetical protein